MFVYQPIFFYQKDKGNEYFISGKSKSLFKSKSFALHGALYGG